MNTKVLAGTGIALLVIGLATANASMGGSADCLSQEWLGDIKIVQLLPDAPGLAVAREVAATEAKGLDMSVSVAKRVVLKNSGVGAADNTPVNIVSLVGSGAPHQLVGAPVGQSVVVTSPCAQVIVDDSGQILLTNVINKPS